MNPYRLYHFSDNSGETEFVVISDQPVADVKREYVTSGVACIQVVQIDEDCASMPCDRPLQRD